MGRRTTVRICSALVIVGALVLSGCAREQPIYEARNHMLPSGAATYSLDQIENRIIKAAKSTGWNVARLGPGALRATLKWGVGDKHVVVVKIEYGQTSFNILHESSQNLLEGMAPEETAYAGQIVIHKRRNERVQALEKAIEQGLYGPAS